MSASDKEQPVSLSVTIQAQIYYETFDPNVSVLHISMSQPMTKILRQFNRKCFFLQINLLELIDKCQMVK